jgi:hypothetical protein
LLLLGCGRIGFTDRGDAAAGDGATDTAGDALANPIVQMTAPTSVGGPNGQVTFTAAPAIGDTAVVLAWAFASTGTSFAAGSVIDDRMNTYQPVVTLSDGCGVAGAIFASTISASHAGQVVTIAPTTGGQVGAVALELASGVVDGSKQSSNPAGGSPYTFVSGAITTTTDHDVVVAVGVPCTFSSTPIVWSDSAGFTTLAVETDSLNHAPGIATVFASHAASSYQDAWTLTYTGGPGAAVGVIAAFR